MKVSKRDRHTRACLNLKQKHQETFGNLQVPKDKRSLRRRLYDRCQFCFWCNEHLAYAEATIEHLIRVADGGKTNMRNCVIACQPCNSRRGTETNREKVAALSHHARAEAKKKKERGGLNARQWANRHRSRGGIPDHWNIPDDAEMQRREAIRNQFIQMCRDIAKEGSK